MKGLCVLGPKKYIQYTCDHQIYVLGPSHLTPDKVDKVNIEINDGILFEDCILEGIAGLPNWSNRVHEFLVCKRDKRRLVWLISDYKFNNSDYPEIVRQPTVLFHNVLGSGNNISRDYMSSEHITVLANHTCKILDYAIRENPSIKFIFWCLYTRSKVYESSYPCEYQYDAMKKKYENNIIDIDKYTTSDYFRDKLIYDKGGHPTQEGYYLLSKMIRENSSCTISEDHNLSSTHPLKQDTQSDIQPLNQKPHKISRHRPFFIYSARHKK